MSDSAKKLSVEISTTATGSGAAKTAEELKKVADVGKKAGDASKNSAKAVNELGENFEKGASAGRILSEVLQGNIAAAAQLAPLIKGLGASLKTNLVGVLITLGAVAAQVLVPLIKGFVDARGKIEAAAKAMEAAKFNADKLGEARLQVLQEDLQKLKEASDLVAESFDRALRVKERLDNAEQAALLAELKTKSGLTDEQRAKEEIRIRDEFASRADQRKLQQAENAVNIATRNAEGSEQKRSKAKQELDSAAAESTRLSLLQQKNEERDREISALQKISALRTNSNTVPQGTRGTDDVVQRLLKLQNEDREAEKVDPADIEFANKNFQNAQKAFLEVDKVNKDNAISLNRARAELDSEKTAQRGEKAFRERVRVAETKPIDKQESERIKELEKVAIDAQAAGEFGKQDEAISQIKKLKKPITTPSPAAARSPGSGGRITFGDESIEVGSGSSGVGRGNKIVRGPSLPGDDVATVVKQSLDEATEKVPEPLDPAKILEASAQLSNALTTMQAGNVAAIAAQAAATQALTQTVQALSQQVRVVSSQLKNSRN